eukprot:scaffold79707_cov46-Prasinocladus_malaysianus.AAC.2
MAIWHVMHRLYSSACRVAEADEAKRLSSSDVHNIANLRRRSKFRDATVTFSRVIPKAIRPSATSDYIRRILKRPDRVFMKVYRTSNFESRGGRMSRSLLMEIPIQF